MLRILPSFWSLINGNASLIIRTAPNTFTSNWRWISSSAVSSIGPSVPYPALLTNTSSLPNFFLINFAASSMLLWSCTSSTIPVTNSLLMLSSSSTCSGFLIVPIAYSPFPETNLTNSRPNPVEQPVINQTLFSIIFSVSDLNKENSSNVHHGRINPFWTMIDLALSDLKYFKKAITLSSWSNS